MGCPSLAVKASPEHLKKAASQRLASGLHKAAAPILFGHWHWQSHAVTVKHCPHAVIAHGLPAADLVHAGKDHGSTLRQPAAPTFAGALACSMHATCLWPSALRQETSKQPSTLLYSR